MWRVMLCLTRPSGCKLGTASPLPTALTGKGLTLSRNSRRWSLSVGEVSSGLLQPLRPATPVAFSSFSATQTFATKSSNRRAKGPHSAKTAKHVDFWNGFSRRSPAEKADVHAAPARVPRAPTTPASENAGTPRDSAHMQPSNKVPPSKPSHPTPLISQSRSLSNGQSTSSGESLDSVVSADDDRRRSSLAGEASTSAAKPSFTASSGNRGKPASQAARKPHHPPGQTAASINGAAPGNWAATAQDPRTPPAQSADSLSGFRRPASPLPAPLPTGAPPAAPHASPDHTAALESSSRLTAESPAPLPPQQGGTKPGTTSLGSTTQASPSSAATSNPLQSPVSAPTASPAEPSMYAQKAVPFDILASSRNGTTAIRDLLETQKITLHEYAPGQKPKVLCPRCHGGSQHEASLAVNISVDSQSAAWLCHRATCGWQGAIDQKTALPKSKKVAVNKVEKPQISKFQPLDPTILQYFAKRGISKQTLERNQVALEHTWMPGKASGTPAIAFPYTRNGEVVNIKYRTMDKCFRQVKGAEKILYGVDDVVGQDTIIIVEGEMDKLALEEAGFLNVVSVPDGAPAKVKEGAVPAPDADTKYSYLWNCRAVLDQATRILMATDNDPPGHALAEELARRLGRERCYRVQWENLQEAEQAEAGAVAEAGEEAGKEAGFRKDANEVLMKDGPEALRFCIDQAEPLPIRGLFRFSDFEQDMWSLYNLEFGDQMGKSTGWQGLDEVYRVVPGELTIITGVPNSGKSEWIDALMVNLANKFGWRFGLCSMEKKVTDHARQLMEKHMRKPFFDGGYAGSTPRMSVEDLHEGMAWVDDRFFPIRYEDEALPSVDWVLNVAKAAVLRYGIRGLLVDPYNELDHQRPSHMSETEYVSQMLTKIKRFAQHHDVHVWFVAHPRQLRDWKGQPPTMYDISGSAHFINKADNGLVIHRNRDPEAGPMNEVQIFVRKVRNKAAGTIGDCKLEYDRATGCYLDHSQVALDDNLYGSFAQPAPESVGHFLPPPGPSFNDVLQRNGSHRLSENVPEMAEALAPAFSADEHNNRAEALPQPLSAVDKVFQSRAIKSARQGLPERNHVPQHVSVPEGPLSNDELEYDDTDVRPGDQIQRFQSGRSAHVMSVR